MTSVPERRPELRISDADRDAAVEVLGEHYLAGRLTKDEYDERAARAWAARTASQLRPLFADLPRSAHGRGAAEQPHGLPDGAAWSSWGPPPGSGGWAFLRSKMFLVVLVVLVLSDDLLPVLIVALVLWLLWSRAGHRRRSEEHRRVQHRHAAAPWSPRDDRGHPPW